MNRVSLTALGLIALALARAPPALAAIPGPSPPCDVPRAMTWRTAAIDPAADLKRLIESGSRPANVLAIKDLRRSPLGAYYPDEIENGIHYCYAIVETDQRNFVYKFWFFDEAGGTSSHGIEFRQLEGKLPDNITLATVGPYLDSAVTSMNNYAINVSYIPDCKLRSKAWGKALRAKILAAVKRDRPDLLANVQDTLDHAEERQAEVTADKDDPAAFDGCHTPYNLEYARQADEVIAGTRSIWPDLFRRDE